MIRSLSFFMEESHSLPGLDFTEKHCPADKGPRLDGTILRHADQLLDSTYAVGPDRRIYP